MLNTDQGSTTWKVISDDGWDTVKKGLTCQEAHQFADHWNEVFPPAKGYPMFRVFPDDNNLDYVISEMAVPV